MFLDESGITTGVQGKLLRVIEEKVVDRIGGRAPIPVDVRVVAATNKDLKSAVEAGEIRGDLFFRLAVFPLEIPPLRERENDIALLATQFAARLGRELRGREATLSDGAVSMLRSHRGRKRRELENALNARAFYLTQSFWNPRILVLIPHLVMGRPQSSLICQAHWPKRQRALRIVERQKILEAMTAADETRCSRGGFGHQYKTLITKLKDYNLEQMSDSSSDGRPRDPYGQRHTGTTMTHGAIAGETRPGRRHLGEPPSPTQPRKAKRARAGPRLWLAPVFC